VLLVYGFVTIFNINLETISQMLAIPKNPNLQILQEETLVGKYKPLK
jgi:hypothetical protein